MEQAGFTPAASVDAIADVAVAYVERARNGRSGS
jgi:hypothetical protein